MTIVMVAMSYLQLSVPFGGVFAESWQDHVSAVFFAVGSGGTFLRAKYLPIFLLQITDLCASESPGHWHRMENSVDSLGLHA